MEQEVSARSQNKGRMAASCLVMLLIGAALIAFGAVMLGAEEDAWWGYILIPVGAIVCVVSVWYIIRVLRQPSVIAVREGDALVFLGQRILFSDIEHVEYSVPNSNAGARWGNLRIRLKQGGAVQCRFVADIGQTVTRIAELQKEYAPADEATEEEGE